MKAYLVAFRSGDFPGSLYARVFRTKRESGAFARLGSNYDLSHTIEVPASFFRKPKKGKT